MEKASYEADLNIFGFVFVDSTVPMWTTVGGTSVLAT